MLLSSKDWETGLESSRFALHEHTWANMFPLWNLSQIQVQRLLNPSLHTERWLGPQRQVSAAISLHPCMDAPLPLNLSRIVWSHFGLLCEKLQLSISDSSTQSVMNVFREGLVVGKTMKTVRFAIARVWFCKKSGATSTSLLELLAYWVVSRRLSRYLSQGLPWLRLRAWKYGLSQT